MTTTSPRRATEWTARRWGLLATFEADKKTNLGMYHLGGCTSCDGARCVGRSYLTHPLGYRSWPACPAYLLKSGHWQAVVRTWNASLVAPLSDWPFRYAAWVSDALNALREAIAKKNAPPKPTIGRPPGPSRGKGF